MLRCKREEMREMKNADVEERREERDKKWAVSLQLA
jgi:hypothetical protein